MLPGELVAVPCQCNGNGGCSMLDKTVRRAAPSRPAPVRYRLDIYGPSLQYTSQVQVTVRAIASRYHHVGPQAAPRGVP